MRRRELQPLLEPVVERLAGHPAISAVGVVGSHSSGLSGPNSDIDLFVYTRAPHEELHGLRHSLASALADPSTLRIVGQAGHPNTDVWALPHTGTWLDIMFWQTAWADAELDRRLVHHIAQPGYTTAFWRSIRDAMPLFERDEWHPSLQNRAQTPYPAGLRDRILSLNTALLGSTNPFSFRNQLAAAVEREDTLAAHGAAAKCLASYFDLIFAANRILHPGEKRLIEIAVTECSNLPTDFESNVMSVTRAPTTRQTVLRVDQMLDRLLALRIE